MDGPPVPKPRSGLGAGVDPSKRPVPLPRRATTTPTIPAVAEKNSAMEKLRSLGISSKQLTEEVAYKVQNRAKSATERIEKSIHDSSKLATGTIERTKSVTKSLFDGTNRMWKTRKNNREERERCVSMPPVDMSLFDKITFKSPLQDQKGFGNVSDVVLDSRNQEGTNCNLDHLSLLSSNSGSMADTTSNASFEELNIDPTYDTPTSSKTNSIVGTPTIPELPVRHSVNRSISYENWILPRTTEQLSTSTNECSSELRQSTILEFDPLSGTSTKYEGLTNGQLLEFQELLNYNEGDDFSLMPDNEYSNSVISTTPPEPPTRVDSIEAKAELTLKKNTDWYVDLGHTEGDKTRIVSSPSGGALDKLKGIFAPSKTQKAQDGQTCIVAKPAVSSKQVYQSGMLTRISSGAEELFKNSPSRYCVLSNQEIVCYSDTVNGNVKERYSLDSINSVQYVLPLSTSTFNFELSISPGPVQAAPRKVVFSTNSNIDRRLWTQKIVEHFTDAFPAKWAAEFTRCGWCYLKEGVGGEWQGNWLMLVRRELVFIRDGAVHTLDLRKARCIVTREADEETRSQCPSDDGHNLLLDCPAGTIYLRFPHEKELKNWSFNVIRSAHSNGQQIHHQQLTRDNVPTIVDKCISFIYAHGTMSEGIYRHGGRDSQLSALLQQFRRDAWAVQLTPGGGYTEHDVAGVLKRFFRELTVPLLPPEMHGALVDALAITDDATRHTALRRLMGSLPLVAGATARKLFSHLRFLHSMEPANKMSAENLAKVWTPNVMPCAWNNEASQIAWSSKLCYVVLELIKNYVSIWQPSAEEMRTEEYERRVLLRTGTAPAAARVLSRGGPIRVWVYVRDKSNSYHITLDPGKTAEDVCVELCARAAAESHALMLQEVICSDRLRRVVHGSELALDIVLRWGYWDEKDRKDNYLIVTDNRLLHDMEALRGSTSLVCGELKFANQLSKSFKHYMFDFQHGKLSYYKDKQGAVKLEEWNIKKIVWYMGHESERNPQARWAITFIPRWNKPKRSKERPWFGCTIAGAVNEDRLKWMTAMMLAEHAAILPHPRLIIT